MTSTNETKSNKTMDLVAIIAIITLSILGGTWLFYGDIIAHWLTELSRLSLLALTLTIGLGFTGGAGYLIFMTLNGAITVTKRAAMVKAEIDQMNEATHMARANTSYRHAEFEERLAHAELIRAEAIAKQYQICEISQTRGAMILVNGQMTTYLPPVQSSQAQLSAGDNNKDLAIDYDKLFRVFSQAKAIHGLLLGSRNGGKSTLVNRLMNIEFLDYDTTIIDDLYNKVDSGWLLHSKVRVTKDFVTGLTEFYQSHKKLADLVDVSRGNATKKLLVIDEAPTLLARLKASDKPLYEKVMAMLRAVYSQGSHTNHNLMMLSQTPNCDDLGLSMSDKSNFIQVAIGKLAKEYLARRQGLTGKKQLYARLGAVANEHEYYACFEDNNGQIDIQPLPDLADFGAKRLYGQVESEAMREADIVPVANLAPVKPDSLQFIEMTDKEKSVIDLALQLENEGRFSIKLLHETLTGKQIGGKQSGQYKEILAKFGYLWLIEKSSTTVQ